MSDWRLGCRSDPQAVSVFDRHYSRRPSAIGSPNCAAPGRVIVLARLGGVWVSRLQDESACRHAWPRAWECAAFRNETETLSSSLIVQAVAITRAIWGDPPPEGFVTFVNPKRVRSTNPGFCYQAAGWTRLRQRTKKNALVVLHLPPERFPAPMLPADATLPLFVAPVSGAGAG